MTTSSLPSPSHPPSLTVPHLLQPSILHSSLLSLSHSCLHSLTHSLTHCPPPLSLSLSLQSQEEPEEGPQNPTHLCHVSSRSEPSHFRVTTSFVRALRLKMACVCRGIGIFYAWLVVFSSLPPSLPSPPSLSPLPPSLCPSLPPSLHVLLQMYSNCVLQRLSIISGITLSSRDGVCSGDE